MFKDVIIGSISTRLKVKKGLIMLLSFLFHSTIIFAVLIGPLLETDTTFSEVKVVDVFLKQVPPHPPRPLKGKTTEEKVKTRMIKEKQKTVKKNFSQPEGMIIAPVEIPEIIPDDDFTFDKDVNSGIDYGIEGGADGFEGEQSGEILGLKEELMNNSLKRISVRQARRIKYVKPIYPHNVQKIRLKQIAVIIEARTDVYGKVVSWKVISGHPLLNGAAINAIKKWEYEPYLVGGIPKAVIFTVTINFILRK